MIGLEQAIEEVRAEVEQLRSVRQQLAAIAESLLPRAESMLGRASRVTLEPAAVEAIARAVAERSADEVREQVEAILATGEPDDHHAVERVASVLPAPPAAAPNITPALQTARDTAKRAPRQDIASLVARAIDTLERDPTKAWKASELRPAIKLFNEGTWARVATRLASHPAVVITGNKLGRTYRAKKAARS